MPEDETQEVPLPPGTIPDQESVITQEVPVLREPFPEVKIVSPVKVELPPLHLRDEPIMTMDAPVPDDTPLYDQLNPPALKPLPKRPRRRMHAGDKFLAGMAVAALGMSVGVYGIAFEGWGADRRPQAEEKPPAPVTIEPTPEEPEPTMALPTTRQRPTPSPEPTRAEVRVVSDPSSYSPEPEESIVVVKSPEPTSAPETPVETSEAPEPSPEPTKPSTPPPSPTPTTPSPTPTPTESSAPPSLSTTLPASPAEESTDG